MNKTKKLTQGAMMLAIVGAMILIDRMTGYWFSELVVLIVPIVIVMYSTMHTFKDGLLLCVGILIITFLLASIQTTYLLYVPAGILTGIGFAYGISKNLDKRTLTFIAIIIYIACEVLITFAIYPLLGFPIAETLSSMLTEYNELYKGSELDFSSFVSTLNLNATSVILMLYIVTTVLLGVMEGAIISILSIFLLKRFKIKDLGMMNLLDVKANPILAYSCMLCLISTAFYTRIENETVIYVLMTLSIISCLILIYYGYTYICIYGTLVLKRKISSFVIILGFIFPAIFFFLMIIGFLYASGPLRRKIEEKLNVKHE